MPDFPEGCRNATYFVLPEHELLLVSPVCIIVRLSHCDLLPNGPWATQQAGAVALQMCEVILLISNGAKLIRHHAIAAKLTQDGNREFKLDDVKKPLKDIKVTAMLST